MSKSNSDPDRNGTMTVEMERLPELLTEREAAGYLRRHPMTLAKWRGAGIGPRYSKLGKTRCAAIVYRKSDLDAWVDRHKVLPLEEQMAAAPRRRRCR